MPPKATRTPRVFHSWQPEERDTLHILYFEYSLHPNQPNIAYQIFSAIFPVATPPETRVRDEWASRNNNGRTLKWGQHHEKVMNTYTPLEGTNRHQARLQILYSAGNLGVTLTPIPAATGLHNAAFAALPVVGPPAPFAYATYAQLRTQPPPAAAPPVAVTGTAGGILGPLPAGPPPLPPPTTTTSGPTTATTGSMPSLTTTSSGTAPGTTGAASGGQQPISPTLPPPTGPPPGPKLTQPVPPTTTSPQIDPQLQLPVSTATSNRPTWNGNRVLSMVHRRYRITNADALGTFTPGMPQFSWNHSHKFGPEDPTWHIGGPVVRAQILPDASDSRPTAVEDVMVCLLAGCLDCLDASDVGSDPSDDDDETTRMWRATSGGMPFVHQGECSVRQDGGVSFTPPVSGGSIDVQHGGAERLPVMYMVGGSESVTMNSAVCQPERCPRCGTPEQGGNAIGAEDETAQPDDDEADTGEPPERDAEDQSTQANDQENTGEALEGNGGNETTQSNEQPTSTEAPEMISDENSLPMVHRSWVYANESGPPLVGGSPSRYACEATDLMDHTFEEWQRGGPVFRLLVKNSSSGELLERTGGTMRDVMLCQLGACEECQIGSPQPYKPYRLPFVHERACRNTGWLETFFEPPGDTPRDEDFECQITRRPVVYSTVTVPSAVCDIDTCSVCSPPEEQQNLRKRAGELLEGPDPKRVNDGTSVGYGRGNHQPATSGQSNELVRTLGVTQLPVVTSNSGSAHTGDPITPGIILEGYQGDAGKIDHFLEMVHREDLVPNRDRAGNLKPDQPRWRIRTGVRYGEGTEGWNPGGMAVQVLAQQYQNDPPLEMDIMVCDPENCPVCYDGKGTRPDDWGSTPGSPFVHFGECMRTLAGLRFMPQVHSDALREGGTLGKVNLTPVQFREGGEREFVLARVCDPGSCAVCGPGAGAAGLGSTGVGSGDHAPSLGGAVQGQNGGMDIEQPAAPNDRSEPNETGYALLQPGRDGDPNRQLCMVHFSDVQQNTNEGAEDYEGQEDDDGVGNWIKGSSKFKAEHRHIFGPSNDMWKLGGQVLNIYVPETRYNGRDIPAAEYNIMACDRDHCEKCIRAVAPTASVSTEPRWFKGLPFVHTSAAVITGDSLTFSPNWGTGLPLKPNVAAYQRIVDYFEAGVRLSVSSWVCAPEGCVRCRPRRDNFTQTILDEPKLKLVHVSRLKHNNYQVHFAAGRQSRYGCLFDDLLDHTAKEWHQKGSVIKVLVPDDRHPMTLGRPASFDSGFGSDDPAGQIYDVMICQAGSCMTCNTPPSRPYRSFRLPFVHKTHCVEGDAGGTLTFQKNPFDVLEGSVNCEIQRRPVIYDRTLGEDAEPLTIMSAVCIPETCPVCRPPGSVLALQAAEDITSQGQSSDGSMSSPPPRGTRGGKRLPTTTRQTRATVGKTVPTTTRQTRSGKTVPGPSTANTGGKRLPATTRQTRSGGKTVPAAPTQPTTTTTVKAPRKIPATTTTTTTTTSSTVSAPAGQTKIRAPSNPLGSGLRMCHRDHVQFKATRVEWGQPPGVTMRRCTLVDQFYIQESNSVYQYGGPAYRISLPNGTVVDAMVCVKKECSSCKHRGGAADVGNSPTNGEGFVHRSQIVGVGGLRTFTPVGAPVYEVATEGMKVQSVGVAFPRVGKTVPCCICVVGACETCDDQGQGQSGGVLIVAGKGGGGGRGKGGRGGKGGGSRGGKGPRGGLGGKGTASVPFTLK